MTTFSGLDYDRIFEIGKLIYNNYEQQRFVRALAVELMARVEQVRGQQIYPNIREKHNRLLIHDFRNSNPRKTR